MGKLNKNTLVGVFGEPAATLLFNFLNSCCGEINPIFTIHVHLTSAQILALTDVSNNDNPVEILPVLPEGKIYNFLAASARYNFVTTSYSIPHFGGLGITYGTEPIATMGGETQGIVCQPESTYRILGIIGGQSGNAAGGNVKVTIVTGLPATGGDGSLDVYMTYQIINSTV